MSKIGRYSADRKKIEALSDDKTIQVADCGTIFTLASGSDGVAGRSGDYILTLPTLAAAGKGWWCKFILTETTGGDVVISGSASDVAKVHVSIQGGGPSGGAATTAGQTQIAAQQSLKFDVSACAINDQVELVTDGLKWYGTALISGSAAVLKA